MVNYRDIAKAEHISAEEAQAAAEQADKDAFVQAGLAALTPLFTKHDNTPVADNWQSYLDVIYFNMEEDDVLVGLTDGSGVYFGVHPREGTVQLYKRKVNPATEEVQWLAGPHVISLHEVGMHLEGGDF